MVIKMDTIDGAHAANAINYVLDKEKVYYERHPIATYGTETAE